MASLLDDRFVIDAGSINIKERILPDLPGKIYLGRSAVRDVAQKRLPELNTYLKNLLALPPNISRDSIVVSFLRQTAKDGKEYTGNKPMKGAAAANTSSNNNVVKRPPEHPNKPPHLPTLRKTSAPPRPLPPKITPSTKPIPPKKPMNKGPRAKALYSYNGQYHDELSFDEGVTIKLISKLNEDWYEGKVDSNTGLVPANYIRVIEDVAVFDAEDDVQSSDEWDDDEDEVGKITCYVDGIPRQIEADLNYIHQPKLKLLKIVVSQQLKLSNPVLNYKDSSGDLVEMCDEEDVPLLLDQGTHPKKHRDNQHAPWTLYITKHNDFSVYNTTWPFKQKR